ncbi:hypothetical protein CAPTEDRAFT_227594 [Capitella teleta]|uniref:Phospholipid scramblase n=1 Tax=Capitella teleta TaxID=283909 RepID=R7TMS7_CAPTE|nr:hypothetical protein CAPTEDRAFT_227594 [Capitella teleta]|eukprot:ELT94807.1 hypothetical protein CAPTEDRAFT_227594 [Capitella teleta]
MANPAGSMPTTVQPGGTVPPSQWMQAPQTPPNCPPGLEYLTQIDQLLVHQQTEVLEAFTGFETNNKYEVKNSMGQRVYFAAEDTNCCTRNICGNERPFEMAIMDNTGREVIHLSSPLRCHSCWFPCCLKKVEVQAPPGNVIGYVRQSWSICKPAYHIQDANDETVLKIQGPCFTCNICGDVEFQVHSADGDIPVGQIRKQWTGIAKEMFTDADNFGITFPLDLDVNVKATLLGAIFLIDFMFFEKDGHKEDASVGMM